MTDDYSNFNLAFREKKGVALQLISPCGLFLFETALFSITLNLTGSSFDHNLQKLWLWEKN